MLRFFQKANVQLSRHITRCCCVGRRCRLVRLVAAAAIVAAKRRRRRRRDDHFHNVTHGKNTAQAGMIARGIKDHFQTTRRTGRVGHFRIVPQPSANVILLLAAIGKHATIQGLLIFGPFEPGNDKGDPSLLRLLLQRGGAGAGSSRTAIDFLRVAMQIRGAQEGIDSRAGKPRQGGRGHYMNAPPGTTQIRLRRNGIPIGRCVVVVVCILVVRLVLERRLVIFSTHKRRRNDGNSIQESLTFVCQGIRSLVFGFLHASSRTLTIVILFRVLQRD
jgi:hypothetical protein